MHAKKPPIQHRHITAESVEDWKDDRDSVITTIMASGGSSDGRKRKADSSDVEEEAPARREPRRGMGVAELERIRVELEMAEACGYAIVPALHHRHFPPPPPCFVPGVAVAHHQYVRRH
jgi:hypothetical protein